MKPSDKKYFWTITFSILVHGLALMGLLDQKIVATTLDEAIPSETAVRLIYSPPSEKPVAKVAQKPKPKPHQKTAVKANTKPVAKAEIKAAKEQISASDPLEPALLPLSPPTSTSQLLQENKTPLPLAGQKHYMALLLNHIEEHKFYPRVARKRGLEGSLRVSFRLLSKNKIAGLEIRGGHKLLRKSAEKAVRSALPMPDIPGQLELPMQVAFLMTYELR